MQFEDEEMEGRCTIVLYDCGKVALWVAMVFGDLLDYRLVSKVRVSYYPLFYF